MLYDWYDTIEFARVWVLPALLMLPVLAWLYYRTIHSRNSTMKVTTVRSLKVVTFRNWLVFFPPVLRLLSIGCVILALARPQIRNVQNETRGQGIDIILCMDVSGSMLSKDFYPNRLEVAKEMAADFVRSRPVDRIGLVVFAGESFTQFPLSTDYENLLHQISSIRSGMLEDGTLIGEGLATAVHRLSASTSATKVVVLLTDGKEEAPDTRIIDPNTALAIARTKGVKVYSIGMAGDAPVAVREKGTTTRSRPSLDEALLDRIAIQTGGQYFRARDKESLQEIYEQIDKLEKSEIEVTTKTRYKEQFHYFMLAALLFLVTEVILRYTLLRTFP